MRDLLLAAILAISSPILTDAETCAAAYKQCGGSGWTGATCCIDGYACAKQGVNNYYSQCIPQDSVPPSPAPDPSATTVPPTPAPTPYGGPMKYKTYDETKVPAHKQGPYPKPDSNLCGQWKLDDNVCVPRYCSNDNTSEFCHQCENTPQCISPPSEVAKSGTIWGEQTKVTANEKWHYSRSTHYGITSGGACGFGLYALCTQAGKKESWINPLLDGYNCDAFCKAYPLLCQDPKNVTLRGNFAAPTGNYYTQFWPHLAGARDNYLSCGECFELVKTKPDGTDYQPGEKGYSNPVVLQITDSCPCENNDKWCCGPGYDHCGEINFKYGCPLPKDSHHLDLSDIAMGRLQNDPAMPNGLIPTRYRRVQCPMPGNVYMWVQDVSGPYYMALAFVNAAGVGSIAKVEIMGAGQTTWTAMETNQDFIQQRPQNRYGSWTIHKDSGPFNPPIAVRITSPNGEQLVNMEAIKSFKPPAGAIPKYNYVDFGLQFSMNGKH